MRTRLLTDSTRRCSTTTTVAPSTGRKAFADNIAAGVLGAGRLIFFPLLPNIGEAFRRIYRSSFEAASRAGAQSSGFRLPIGRSEGRGRCNLRRLFLRLGKAMHEQRRERAEYGHENQHRKDQVEEVYPGRRFVRVED